MGRIDTTAYRAIPVTRVLEALGMEVGRGRFTLCPAHADRHASLHVDLRRNNVHCFACQWTADPIGLVMKVEGCGFVEACQWLERLTGGGIAPVVRTGAAAEAPQPRPFDASRYERHFLRPWLMDEAREFLFRERRLSAKAVEWARLTSWRDREGTAWLQIPYYDMAWRLVGVQNRRLTPSDVLPRFRFASGMVPHVYGLPILRGMGAGETLYFAEGCSDTWAVWSAGMRAVGIPSASLLRADDLAILKDLGIMHWAMFPDNDEAGRHLRDQLLRVATCMGASLVINELPEGVKDYSVYYRARLPSLPP